MSARTHPLPRIALPVVVLTAALLAPSAALADPPALNRDPCSVQLAPAAHFPGGYDTDAGSVRLVSDAYVTYLSTQPPGRTTGE